ncbi:MAG: hypothetical protein ACK5LN_04795 [Propioniciclava sp.]
MALLLLVVLIVGSLMSGAFMALGFGPLLGWLWASFTAAGAWWAEVLIALAPLAVVAGLVLLSGWITRKVRGVCNR